MERFESITGILADSIKDAFYYTCEDLENRTQNALKLNSWILLGSLTETTLQMFFVVHNKAITNDTLEDYLRII